MVDTPTQTATVNEEDYSQIFDDPNFYRALLWWAAFLKSMPEKILPRNRPRPSEELFEWLSRNSFPVWNISWCKYSDGSLAEMSEAFCCWPLEK